MKKISMDNQGNITVKTIGFILPIYLKGVLTDTEYNDVNFAAAVERCAYDYLMSTLKDNDDDDADTLEEKAEKREALKAVEPAENGYSEFRAVKSFAIGIGHVKSTSVPSEYIETYNKSVSYVRKYRETNEWTDGRKAEYNDLRQSMIDCFNSIFSLWIKEGFSLKVSSKAVNSYIESLYIMKNNNGGKAGTTATVYKTLPIQAAFIEFMKAINTVTGVTREKRVKTVETF